MAMSSEAGRPAVAVIGAGIVGICCAAYLVQKGYSVTLYDRRGLGEETSFGNLGGIQSLAATPLSLPGMWKELPSWLMDQSGPLTIRPSYFPNVAGWLLRFWNQSRLDRVWHNARALNALNSSSVDAHLALARWARLEDLFEIPGQLYVWTTRKSYESAQLSRQIWASTGHDRTELDAKQILELEPDSGGRFEVGLHIPGNGFCRNPERLCTELGEHAIRNGVKFKRVAVQDFVSENDEVVGVRTDRGVEPFEHVVLAAGIWSRQLVSRLGYELPLETQRGYHVTIRNPGLRLSRMLLVIDKKIAVTPMETGLRIGGTVEFAGLSGVPDYIRAEALLRLGSSLFPQLRTDAVTEWMGHRPCLPDSLPVIGRAEKYRNLYFAFGHGHMGLLGSAPTGRIIADLVAGCDPSIDIRPFRIERFQEG